jgi:transglutaminase-like putative cysteine protease
VKNHSLGSELNEYLCSTHVIDSDHSRIIRFANSVAAHETTDIARGVALYYAVRDGIRYDPYSVDLSVAGLRASHPKAVLLAAAARAMRIPSRLGFADVKNHLATERLQHMMHTDLFVFHGYTELYLNGRWVKATPAFNESLCQRLKLEPLAFDGCNDSVLQPIGPDGKQFIQYVTDRGTFADVPIQEIRAAFEEHYPSLMAAGGYRIRGSFEDEAAAQER